MEKVDSIYVSQQEQAKALENQQREFGELEEKVDELEGMVF